MIMNRESSIGKLERKNETDGLYNEIEERTRGKLASCFCPNKEYWRWRKVYKTFIMIEPDCSSSAIDPVPAAAPHSTSKCFSSASMRSRRA